MTQRTHTPRSPFAPFYWLIFAASLAVVVGLNLAWPGKPEQDPSLIFRDAWFVWGFSYFGLLITLVAALMVDDGRRRGMFWYAYVGLYFFIGILPLSVYLARRPVKDIVAAPTPRWLELRWVYALLAAAVIPLSVALLPQGSLDELVNTLNHNAGFWFMWLDIAANHLAVLPLAQADMRRRGVAKQGAWLAAIAVTGSLGLGLYLASRPPVQHSL